MRLVAVIVLFFLAGVSARSQSVLINEVQNRNYNTIADEDGDYEDWVELRNVSANEIDLQGYGVSDDQADPFKWVLPDVIIPADGFLLIWLSGKDRTDSELHTNFSLTESEPLLIMDPSQGEFDIFPPINLTKDVSYGRDLSASSFVYFETPTPGAPNLTEAFSGICSPPTFSHSSGFYTEGFELIISSDPTTAVIYTLDGSDPESDRVEHYEWYKYKNRYAFNPAQSPGPFLYDSVVTHLYGNPLSIVDVSATPDRLSQKASSNDFAPSYFPDEPSYKGMVVRARSTAENLLPSEIVSAVFFISPEGWSRYDLPVVSVVLEEIDLFEYLIGIHTAGRAFDAWREDNPLDFPPPINSANYGRRGTKWERPVAFEYFDMENETVAISKELGVRIHGASSRKFPRKSFRFYTRSLYGSDAIQYPLFEDHYTNTFERFLLRNGGGDEKQCNMRDAVIQKMAAPMNAITSAAQPAYLFINGEFYGLNNFREYYDDNYFKIRYGVEREDLDLIKGGLEIAYGTLERLDEVDDLCTIGGFASEATMDQFEEWVDLNSFTDVFIAHMISANTDMLPKNTLWWRNKNVSAGDDRFFSALLDLDKAWGSENTPVIFGPDYDMIAHFLDNTDEAQTPYLKCFLAAMENDSFAAHFITRTADVLNTFFSAKRATSLIQETQNEYHPHYAEHIDRWSGNNNVQNVDEWLGYMDDMVAFAETRPNFHRQHIAEFFETDGQYDLVLEVSHEDHGYIHLNTIAVNESTEGIDSPVYPWEGIYFKNVPITVTAIPSEGFLFSHWEGALAGISELEVNSTFEEDSVFVKAVFVADSTVGTANVEAAGQFQAFPNPSIGTFRIHGERNSIERYRVYDAAGREVLSRKFEHSEDLLFSINGSPGVYILEIESTDGELVRLKLVKQ